MNEIMYHPLDTQTKMMLWFIRHKSLFLWLRFAGNVDQTFHILLYVLYIGS